jgi:hypothetical protein
LALGSILGRPATASMYPCLRRWYESTSAAGKDTSRPSQDGREYPRASARTPPVERSENTSYRAEREHSLPAALVLSLRSRVFSAVLRRPRACGAGILAPFGRSRLFSAVLRRPRACGAGTQARGRRRTAENTLERSESTSAAGKDTSRPSQDGRELFSLPSVARGYSRPSYDGLVPAALVFSLPSVTRRDARFARARSARRSTHLCLPLDHPPIKLILIPERHLFPQIPQPILLALVVPRTQHIVLVFFEQAELSSLAGSSIRSE